MWLLVACGAGLSLGVREYVGYRAARELTERKIGAKERELDRMSDALLTWDEIEARNVLRRARGTKTFLGLQDVDDILADAIPRLRLERLTFVFPSTGPFGLRRRRVEVRVDRRVLAVWHGRVSPPPRSVAFVERLWASGARLGATLVGVIVAGAVAVALYRSGKAFGGWADVVAAVMTGLGADLTLIAGGGKLLDTVLQTLQGPREP